MFKNIGKKIQILAYVVLFFWIIVCTITGIGLAIQFEGVVLAFLGIIVGFIGGWLNPFMIYALGQLLENISSMNFNIKKITDKYEKDRSEN